MKTASLWIIRVALTVQFLGVLAVPTLVAGTGAPRAMWMAEWMNPIQESNGRTIGVLRLRDGKLTFVEQIGQLDWELDLANVKRVSVAGGGKSVAVSAVSGEDFVVSIMDANLTQGSPGNAVAAIDRALQSITTNGR